MSPAPVKGMTQTMPEGSLADGPACNPDRATKAQKKMTPGGYLMGFAGTSQKFVDGDIEKTFAGWRRPYGPSADSGCNEAAILPGRCSIPSPLKLYNGHHGRASVEAAYQCYK